MDFNGKLFFAVGISDDISILSILNPRKQEKLGHFVGGKFYEKDSMMSRGVLMEIRDELQEEVGGVHVDFEITEI